MKVLSINEVPQGWPQVLSWLQSGETVLLKPTAKLIATTEIPDRVAWVKQLRERKLQIFGSQSLTVDESAMIRDRGEW